MFPVPRFITTPPSLAVSTDDCLSARARRTVMLALQAFGMAIFLWVHLAHRQVSPLVILIMEAIFIGWVGFRLIRIANTVRSSTTPRYVRGIAALRETLLTAFPGPVGHVMVNEIAMWLSLWRLATRWRRKDLPAFTYHKGSTGIGMLVVVIMTAPVEILLFELLIPWEPVRWFLLVAAVYSVIWFAGFTLAPMAYPHTLGRNRLTIHNGALTRIDVPLANIATIDRERIPWPPTSGRIPPGLVVRDTTAYLPGNDRNQIRLVLREPQVVAPEPDARPVSRILFTADAADALVATVEARLPRRDDEGERLATGASDCVRPASPGDSSLRSE